MSWLEFKKIIYCDGFKTFLNKANAEKSRALAAAAGSKKLLSAEIVHTDSG